MLGTIFGVMHMLHIYKFNDGKLWTLLILTYHVANSTNVAFNKACMIDVIKHGNH